MFTGGYTRISLHVLLFLVQQNADPVKETLYNETDCGKPHLSIQPSCFLTRLLLRLPQGLVYEQHKKQLKIKMCV